MSAHPRVLVVVLRSPERPLALASSEVPRLPPRDAVQDAALLLRLGAEVRVIDQLGERITDRVVRREMRLWRADLVLAYAGGSRVAANPVPDAGPLATVAGDTSRPVVVVGPLADFYAEELVATIPALAGALRGGIGPRLVEAARRAREHRLREASVPGLCVRGAAGAAETPVPPEPHREPPEPAWHLLPLGAYLPTDAGGRRVVGVLAAAREPERTLAIVRHAVHRAGAGRIHFEDRDFAEDTERTRRVARGMFGAAPSVPWSCRIRADRLDAMLALALFQGGCCEVLVTSPVPDDAPGLPPMDDPARPAIETAVDLTRVTGMAVAVEHVVGRPGHDRDILAAWQRWYDDRRVAVRPHVRVLHAGACGPGAPTLSEARERAGCWGNELRPRDVERAVRSLSQRPLTSRAG